MHIRSLYTYQEKVSLVLPLISIAIIAILISSTGIRSIAEPVAIALRLQRHNFQG